MGQLDTYMPEQMDNPAADAPDVGGMPQGQANAVAGASVFASVITSVGNVWASHIRDQMANDTMTFNGKLKEIQGRLMMHSAKLAADRTRKRGVSFVKGQQAKYAALGVSSEGSPVQVMLDTTIQFELDARLTEINGNMGQANKQLESASAKSVGSSYLQEGISRAGTTLLTTTLDVAEKYYNPKGKD